MPCHDLVDQRKVAQVGEEDIQFYDVLQAAAGGFADGRQVAEHLFDLRFHVTVNQLHGFRHQRNLAGQIHGRASLDGLGIGANGLRSLVGADYGMVGHDRSSLVELLATLFGRQGN